MIDRTGPSESGLFLRLRNTTYVFITLGSETFGVWHEQDMWQSVGGQKMLADFSNERDQNWGVRPHGVFQTAVPSQTRAFLNVLRVCFTGELFGIFYESALRESFSECFTGLLYVKVWPRYNASKWALIKCVQITSRYDTIWDTFSPTKCHFLSWVIKVASDTSKGMNALTEGAVHARS